ncbi:MAG: hypothetical protein ACO3X1_13030 [Burkholderiaceae bacterium]
MTVEVGGDRSYREPLTDAEIAALWPGATTWAALFEFARRIEKAHGIKKRTADDSPMSRMQKDIR